MSEADEQESFWSIPRSRLYIYRDIFVLGFLFLLAWKMLDAKFNFELAELKVTDLLALLLALFAIWLSALFYFKATESSNKFYDNTYKFTKEISEILGRIEAGFGERLRHLDEGYAGIVKTMATSSDPTKTAKEVQETQETIREKEEILRDDLSRLAERASLEATEKAEVMKKFTQQERELIEARSELERLQRRLKTETSRDQFRPGMLTFTDNVVIPALRKEINGPPTARGVIEAWRKVRDENVLIPAYLRDMSMQGFATADGVLTGAGVRFLRDRLRQT